MKNVLSFKSFNRYNRKFSSNTIKNYSLYFKQNKPIQLRQRDSLVQDLKTPPTYSPIVYEDDKQIVYETHPLYESIEITERDYRESRKNEALKFKISGLESQVAVIDLYPNQRIKSETDKVVYLTSGIEMNTVIGGFMSSFKRLFSGSTVFIIVFRHKYG